jgi:hypothetical protein
MKKIFTISILVIMVLILVGCGKVQEPVVNNETNQETNEQVSEEESTLIKSAIENFLAIKNRATPLGIVYYIGFETVGDETKLEATKIDQLYYYITDIKFEDFKQKILTYMTEEEYEIISEGYFFKDVEGNLYVLDGGKQGGRNEVLEYKLLSQENGLYTYEVESNYYEAEAPAEKVTYKIEVIKSGENYLISNFE